MWRKARVTVGDMTMHAMVDFNGRDPVFVEWPARLVLNTPIMVGEDQFFSGTTSAVGGLFETSLMIEPLLADPEHVGAIVAENAGISKDANAKPKSARKPK